MWAASERAAAESVSSHLLTHDRDSLSKDGFQIRWQCPHCERVALRHDQDEAIESFKQHLYSHAGTHVESGSHVADEIDGTGNVLVLTQPETSGATNARVHFLARCDVAIILTTNVSARLTQLASRSSWPDRTILITTNEEPLAGLEEIAIPDVSLEVVQLSKQLGLAGIGETLSRVVAAHNSPARTLSVEFGILTELVRKCELERVFHFLHLLTTRFENAGALSHYYYNPESTAKPTVNLLAELFDMTIYANGDRFVLKH